MLFAIFIYLSFHRCCLHRPLPFVGSFHTENGTTSLFLHHIPQAAVWGGGELHHLQFWTFIQTPLARTQYVHEL